MDDPQDHEQPRDINADALDEVYGPDEQQQEQARIQRQMAADFHGAFSTEDGQRALVWMKRFWGGFTFDPENARQDAFNQGQRHVVETIENLVQQIDEGEL